MRVNLSVIPGAKPLLAIALPVLLAIGAVAGAYVFTSATTKAGQATTAAAVAAAANADVPAPAGLLVPVDADITRLPNLAGRLKDGEQIKVPYAKGTTGGTVVTRTNLNLATVEELEVVPGFTSAFAQDVIDYRTNFGGFQNTRELVDILGMSEADYVIVRRYLTL